MNTKVVLAVLLALNALHCGDMGNGSRDTPQRVLEDPVVARVNSLVVRTSDLVSELRSGRLGGSPELVLDELVSFALVLRECDEMDPGSCEGDAPMHERALAFLERLFPVGTGCEHVSRQEYAARYDAMRRVLGNAGPDDPLAVLTVTAAVCRARAKTLRRQWVKALRKNAVVKIYDQAVKRALANVP